MALAIADHRWYAGSLLLNLQVGLVDLTFTRCTVLQKRMKTQQQSLNCSFS